MMKTIVRYQNGLVEKGYQDFEMWFQSFDEAKQFREMEYQRTGMRPELR